eukprot:366250-Chlamydomonas_euryale.AAC.9
MLSIVENAGVALVPKDARDRVLQNESRRELLHSNVLGDGSNQTAPWQGTLRVILAQNMLDSAFDLGLSRLPRPRPALGLGHACM